MRHSEVAAQILLRVPATLMSDDHHRVAVEARPTADDRRVLTKRTVSVELDKVGEDEPKIVVRQRPLVRPSNLHALQRSEILVDLLAQLAELALQRRNLLGDIELAITGELLQLVDLSLQLENGLFKVQCGRGHNGYVRSLSQPGRD